MISLVVKVSVVGIVVSVLNKYVKELKPELTPYVTLGFVVISFPIGLLGMKNLAHIMQDMGGFGVDLGMLNPYMKPVLKVLGLSWVSSVTSNVCQDLGETAIASSVEMVGKTSIIIVATDILLAVLNALLEIMKRF